MAYRAAFPEGLRFGVPDPSRFSVRVGVPAIPPAPFLTSSFSAFPRSIPVSGKVRNFQKRSSWWEPPASAGGAGLQSSEEKPALKQGFSRGTLLDTAFALIDGHPPQTLENRYCTVNITGVIMPQTGRNASNGKYGKGEKVRHPPPVDIPPIE